MTNARKKKGLILDFSFILAHLSCVHYSSAMGSLLTAEVVASNETFLESGMLPQQLSRDPMSQEDKADEGTCPSEIYSCRGRCSDDPRPACSCHRTCQFYGNCCEDYAEICNSSSAEAVRYFPTPGDVTVKCIADSLLISSCSKEFVQILKQKEHGEMTDTNGRNVYSNGLMTRILDSGFDKPDVLSQ